MGFGGFRALAFVQGVQVYKGCPDSVFNQTPQVQTNKKIQLYYRAIPWGSLPQLWKGSIIIWVVEGYFSCPIVSLNLGKSGQYRQVSHPEWRVLKIQKTDMLNERGNGCFYRSIPSFCKAHDSQHVVWPDWSVHCPAMCRAPGRSLKEMICTCEVRVRGLCFPDAISSPTTESSLTQNLGPWWRWSSLSRKWTKTGLLREKPLIVLLWSAPIIGKEERRLRQAGANLNKKVLLPLQVLKEITFPVPSALHRSRSSLVPANCLIEMCDLRPYGSKLKYINHLWRSKHLGWESWYHEDMGDGCASLMS